MTSIEKPVFEHGSLITLTRFHVNLFNLMLTLQNIKGYLKKTLREGYNFSLANGKEKHKKISEKCKEKQLKFSIVCIFIYTRILLNIRYLILCMYKCKSFGII